MGTRIEKIVLTVLALALLTGAALWAGAPGAAAGAPAAPAPAAEARKLRVGTYDPRCVALAWSRSKHFTGGKLIEEAQAAKQAGNQARFEVLKQQLEREQERLHSQVFSDGRVDNLLAVVADKLPAVAAECRVDLIASGPVYAAAGVEVATVDVTDAIVQLFEPNDKTLKTIAQIRVHPIEWRSFKEHKD